MKKLMLFVAVVAFAFSTTAMATNVVISKEKSKSEQVQGKDDCKKSKDCSSTCKGEKKSCDKAEKKDCASKKECSK